LGDGCRAWVLLCSVAITLWFAARVDAAVSAARDEPPRAAAREVPKVNASLVARISEAMQVQRLYPKENLTVADLARVAHRSIWCGGRSMATSAIATSTSSSTAIG
jgi:hypothetical protein